MTNATDFLDALALPANAPLLTGILRGVEKESLRVQLNGQLAQTPHPHPLGSALTHPSITTDYSEALLEFISSPSHRTDAVMQQLKSIHQYTYQHLSDELLWPTSMPCMLPSDDEIPVANYGTSNNGKMKTIYRLGLGLRYGRKMQTISGIHYNFSLPNSFWALLHRKSGSLASLQQFKTDQYFALIRNFRRYYWLLLYFFGASPAICRSFTQNMTHRLTPMSGLKDTLHTPFATSLRMSDLGYQSDAQKSLSIDYNDLPSYLLTLCNAIRQPYSTYEAQGVTDTEGNFHQLNTSLLQIENEFYSPIRPKRTAKRGETALQALRNRGVEYIEVRCLDLNPFEPLGMSESQMHFLDSFLVFCLLEPSPPSSAEEHAMIQHNQHITAYEGRNPALQLHSMDGDRSLKEWGADLLTRILPIAATLDAANGHQNHVTSVQKQIDVLNDESLTPSANILATLTSRNWNFSQFALHQAKEHANYFHQQTFKPSAQKELDDAARASLVALKRLESANDQPFEHFLEAYFQQYRRCSDIT